MSKPDFGVSYDSSKLRATLIHIDIEEMCRCLSQAIISHIAHTIEMKNEIATMGTTTKNLVPDFFGDESLIDTL
jgi:hypothetical protein